MTRRPLLATAALLAIALLAACSPGGAAHGPAVPTLDADRLDAGIDAQLGGLGTCVILKDLKSGKEVYHYGHFDVCGRPLPPCDTFDLVTDLIGLDLGLVTPRTVFKWDGTPQPITLWQADADMTKAAQNGVVWWQQRLARQIGMQHYAARLSAFGYGSKTPAGASDAFWLGPQAGGDMTVSTGGQVDFIRRFYGAMLPVSAQALAAVQALTADETRTDAKGAAFVISGRTASCASQADGSRTVGWYVGRLRTPTRDMVFAASVEGADAPPGLEIARRLKGVFSDVDLWPAG